VVCSKARLSFSDKVALIDLSLNALLSRNIGICCKLQLYFNLKAIMKLYHIQIESHFFFLLVWVN
jgi:hypothetical protein